MRRFMVMLVAVVMAASLMAPAVAGASFGQLGSVAPARAVATVTADVTADVPAIPLYKCYTLDKATAQLRAMPPGVAWLYLVALGWPTTATLEQFFALSFAERCAFYLASIPPGYSR